MELFIVHWMVLTVFLVLWVRYGVLLGLFGAWGCAVLSLVHPRAVGMVYRCRAVHDLSSSQKLCFCFPKEQVLGLAL